MNIIDITPRITHALGVWPGDTPPTREVLLDMHRGDALTLSTLHATVHLGAHADAPSHYGTDAPTIERCALDVYVGPCQVVHAKVPRHTRPVRPTRVYSMFTQYACDAALMPLKKTLHGDPPHDVVRNDHARNRLERHFFLRRQI